MKFTHKLYISLIVAVVGTTSSFAQQKIKIDGVAAVVGEHIVLESDIQKFKQEILSRDKNAPVTDCQIMEQIMKQKLIAHHAVVDSIVVADEEVASNVQRTLAHFKQQLGGDMTKVVELYGFENTDDLTAELTRIEKENLLSTKEKQEIVKDVAVTPVEIRFFYNDLKAQKQLPSFGVQVELSQITMSAKPTEASIAEVVNKLKGLKDEVDGGASMHIKAILHSEDPGVAQNGGLYTITRQSQFVKEFKEAAFGMEEGEVSEPFKSQFGYHILKVEKVKGQQRDVRHILLQPKVKIDKLNAAKTALESVRANVIAKEITFDEAVAKHSEDENTKFNKGILSNPVTSDAKFELNKMDPKLFAKIDQLKEGEMTEVFLEENREGDKVFKIILIRKRYAAHEANLEQDYERIQQLALQNKQKETVDDWSLKKIKDTHIKISKEHNSCDFEYKWIKN